MFLTKCQSLLLASLPSQKRPKYGNCLNVGDRHPLLPPPCCLGNFEEKIIAGPNLGRKIGNLNGYYKGPLPPPLLAMPIFRQFYFWGEGFCKSSHSNQALRISECVSCILHYVKNYSLTSVCKYSV